MPYGLSKVSQNTKKKRQPNRPTIKRPPRGTLFLCLAHMLARHTPREGLFVFRLGVLASIPFRRSQAILGALALIW